MTGRMAYRNHSRTVTRRRRRLRQVEQCPDGDALRTEDWPLNPPIDLRDPQYSPMEISAEAFEDAWRRARPDPEAN